VPARHQIFEQLRQELVAIPVVDTHDHIRPRDTFERPFTVSALLRNTYVNRCLRVADGSANGIPLRRDSIVVEDSWKATKEIVERVKLTSFYRWLLRGLVDLYDLPSAELDETAWKRLSVELARRYTDPDWQRTVLDRARIQTVIWDPFWKAGTWGVPEVRFRPSLRISSSLAAFHPDASDYEGCNLIRDWSQTFNVTVDSLTDLEDLIERVLAENLRAGCRSLKSPIAYERTLAVGPTSRATASGIFGTSPGSISADRRLAFGDYVIHFCLERAREHGLIVQVHTGLARLSDSNPLLLARLLEEYPDVTFDVFHGGYPWVHEVGALAQNYPNVRLNLVWLPQLSTEAAIQALKEWFQVVPQLDRICWGADSWTVEEMYGGLQAAKFVLARALADLVDEEYMSLDDAVTAAQSVLYRGGAKIYGVERERVPDTR